MTIKRGSVVNFRSKMGTEFLGVVLELTTRGDEEWANVKLDDQRTPVAVPLPTLTPVTCIDCGDELNTEDSDGKKMCRGCWVAHHADFS